VAEAAAIAAAALITEIRSAHGASHGSYGRHAFMPSLRPTSGVIHHSDQGSQYTSIEFGHRCRDAGVRPSMGSVGNAGACPRPGVAGPGG
jgi:transposase InsO family protein